MNTHEFDQYTSKLTPEPWLTWRRTDRQLAFCWRVGSFGALGRPRSITRWVCVCGDTFQPSHMRHCGPPPTGQFGLTTPTTLHDALMDVLQSKQIWTDEHTALLQIIATAAKANGQRVVGPPSIAPVRGPLAPNSTIFSCMDVFLLLKRERMFIAALRCLSVLLTDLGGSAELAH